MSFKETRTADNLMKSFAGESQARMRYLYAAKGLHQVVGGAGFLE